MEKGWKIAFTTNNLAEAEIVKSLLSENGIIALILDQPTSFPLVEEIEICVKEEDLETAKQLISKQNGN